MTAGTYGSSSNAAQVAVDQYGRITSASNVAITASSQWSTINGNVAYQNGVSIGTLSNPPVGSNLYVLGTANVTSLNVSDNLSVKGAFVSNATNTSFLYDTFTIPYLNTLNILAQGTSNMNTLNVTTLFANTATIFGSSTLNVLGTSNLNLVIGQLYLGNGSGLSNLNASNLAFGVVNSALILGNTLSNIQFSNVSGLVTGNALSNLNASNLAFGVVNSTLIYGNTLSNITGSNVTGNVANATVALVVSQAAQPNITSVGLLTNLAVSNSLTTSNVSMSGTLNVQGVSNVTNIYALRYFGDGGLLSNISSNAITQPFANLVVSNAVTTANLFVTTANVRTLNVASLETTGNLSVSGNIIPVTQGNTYVLGNLVVAGNVFSSLGYPLGEGGGYYFSLPGDIALQVPYNGALYGTTYPLSVGLSNGWTITGTSTLITVTTNGNFKFNKVGVYKLSAVLQGSTDNMTALAVGSNVADVHGTDQGYMYRYTTFLTQNPTELIEIPFNVTDASKYYYLDLWCVNGGALKATTTGTGGTYLTITPLQGGGLASGGPGGTPGTQWISSASNIYFPNAIGVGGAPTPGYNLTVTGQSQMGNVIPTVDNLYNLGTAALRWANLQIGPGTIYMQDQAPPYTQIGISVYNGTLLLDGVQSIRTGNVAFIDPVTNNAATMNVTNKVVTYSNVSAVKAGNVIYSDGLTQSNAYIKPTSNVLPTSPTVTSVLVDLASSNAFVHCHAGSSLNISVVNPTPAKEVQVFVTVAGGGPKPWGLITCSGIGNILTANTVDSNPYYVYQTICKVSVTSVDTTTQNTFAVIENYYHT